MRRSLFVALALMLCAGSALALNNPGFETGGFDGWDVHTSTGGASAVVFDSWSDLNSSVMINAGAGTYSGGFSRNSSAHSVEYEAYTQDIPVVQGNTYDLTVSGKVLAYLTESYIDNPWALGARVGLYDGTTAPLWSIDVDYSGKLGQYDGWLGVYNPEIDDFDSVNGQWIDFSFNTGQFTAQNSALQLRLLIHDKKSLNDDPEGYELAAFDNVQVSAVPEPGSIAALLCGLVGFAGCARRRS